MTLQAGAGSNINIFREQRLNAYNQLRLGIDPVRGVLNARVDFGAGGQAATALVTLATSAPGATRGRVVAIIYYAAATTTYIHTDNSVAIFTSIYAAAIGNTFVSKEQLGEGGLIFSTDFTMDPNANGSIAWCAWIPEYDVAE